MCSSDLCITYSFTNLDRTKIECYSTKRRNPTKMLGIIFTELIEGENVKLSTKGRYGLRAIVDLAKYSENEPVSIGSIAERQDISERYLEQLMAKLKKADLVKSIRGAGGGYVLAKAAEDISAGDVLRALEGDLEPAECLAYHEGGCEASGTCVTKYVWKQINEKINETVDGIKLSTLVEESKKVNCEEEKTIKACSNNAK